MTDTITRTISDPTALAERLTARLAELCGDRVPGASVALTDGTTVVQAVHGVTSLRTQQPVTTSTLFQIGSITKVYTATLIMKLVDEGKVELDAPVRTYLPWFAVQDEDATEHVTIRDLLRHTAGFEGDDFTDTGVGDDALKVYGEGLAKAAQITPRGRMFSYCNSGFSVLGMVVEAVTGGTWDAAVVESIATPLGLTLGTLAHQVILQPHALGHLDLPGADGEPVLQVAPVWAPPRSVGPAGTICSSASDVLAFAKGQRTLLSQESYDAMQSEQVVLDDPWILGRAWGLGWILPVEGIVGHDGSTFGQYAFLRYQPSTGAGLALLTNGPGARAVFEALAAEFLEPLTGLPLEPKAVPADVPPAVDADRSVGDYARQEVRIEVRKAPEGEDGLDITMVPIGNLAALSGPPEALRFVGFQTDPTGDTVVTKDPMKGAGVRMTARFITEDGDQRATWVHLGARATRRSA